MNNLTKKLINDYIKACQRKNHFKISISLTDEKHKNFKYFEQLSKMYKNVPGFDSYSFIEANLADKIRFPAQLITKTSLKRYMEYRDALLAKQFGNTDDEYIIGFKNSVKIITDKIGSYDLDKFFDPNNPEMSIGISFFMRGLIYQNFCIVCKQFWIKIKNLDNDILQMIDFEDLKNKRCFVLSLNSKLLTKLKNIIGKENYI